MKHTPLVAVVLLAFFASCVNAQSTRPSKTDYPYVAEQTLASQLFPLFESIEKQKPFLHTLMDDPTLAHLTEERWHKVELAMQTCGESIECLAESVTFKEGEIASITSRLRFLYESDNAFRVTVHSSLEPREEYTLTPRDSDETVLIDSCRRSALAINQIIATYAEGASPRYKNIDSMSLTSGSNGLTVTVKLILADLELPTTGTSTDNETIAKSLFFMPSLRFAIRLLQANTRDEAGRYWPLRNEENKAAISYAPRISWGHYRYSAILIPGGGPETYDVRLSEASIERLRSGVAAFRRGAAPYLLVSGGFVHPSQTRYCEALEMKRYLMDIYGIPEAAILVDPYSRHTTTNLRNAARLVFDYHLPADRPMIVVSDMAQVDAIVSDAFSQRNRQELGYMPVAIGQRLSSTEVEATPLRVAYFRDPRDPLDP